MMHGFGLGGLVAMIFTWLILIAGSVWLIKLLFSGNLGQSSPSKTPEEDALEILKKRYARGEIQRDEFELMKNDLRIRE